MTVTATATKAHVHTYRTDIADWWCATCDTVTDYCAQPEDVEEDDADAAEDLTAVTAEADRVQAVMDARRHLAQARELLDQVCREYSAESYALNSHQHAAWCEAVAMARPLDGMDL